MCSEGSYIVFVVLDVHLCEDNGEGIFWISGELDKYRCKMFARLTPRYIGLHNNDLSRIICQKSLIICSIVMG